MAEKKKKTELAGRKKASVQMVVRHEFVGTKTLTDAFIPVICEDIRRKAAGADTFDKEEISA